MQIKIRLSSILFVGQLALVFLMLTSCQKDADTTMKVSDPIVDSVESADGVMIHYEILGAGEPTLVFVHGWSSDRSYWKTQMDEFSKTYQVVSIDIGGHGESGLRLVRRPSVHYSGHGSATAWAGLRPLPRAGAR